MTGHPDSTSIVGMSVETEIVEGTEVEAAKEEAEKLGRAIGEAEGREIGIAEGREEVMVTAVNKLLKNGVSIEIIADSLGITIDKAKGYII